MAKSTESAIQELKGLIKLVPDFPKPGVLFRDVMPIFKDPDAVTSLIDLMVAYIEAQFPEVEVIAGLDARGFLIGPLIAHEIGKSFVPVRKAGKLPGKTIRRKSSKEYGEDILEIQADSVKPGDKVVIVDDLLATGGTMNATCELLKEAQCNLLGCLCLIELEELKGREKLKDVKFQSVIKY